MKCINKLWGRSCALLVILAPLSLPQVSTSGVTLSVAQYGAVGNNSSDDTQALQRAIQGAPTGATLDFGDISKTYLISRSLILKPGVTYRGQATLRLSPRAAYGSQVALLLYGQSDNVTLDGLTFDSNNIGGGIAIAVNGGGEIPARNVTLTHLSFRNTMPAPRGGFDGAVFNPVGWLGGSIDHSTFTNCGSGISLVNAQNLVISDNTFNSIGAADAIFLTATQASFSSGTGIKILRNQGQDLGRIAIEIWSPLAFSNIQGVVIADNAFTNWRPNTQDMFGISVMTGTGAQISNNSLVGGAAGLGYGIELGAPGSTVDRNTVRDFHTGIIVQNGAQSSLTNNLLLNQEHSGIELSNAPGSKAGQRIANNKIWNARKLGIFINTTDWGGTTLSANNIMRTGGIYSDDATAQFTGIGITPPSTPVSLSNNSVMQVSANPPTNFGFMGIRLNGPSPSSIFDRNVVVSSQLLSNSTGIFSNSPGVLDGATLTNNTFQLLGSATSGPSSSAVQSSNNSVINCLSLGTLILNSIH